MSGAGKALAADTPGGRTEDVLFFNAVLTNCDAGVGFCTGYVLAADAAGGTPGAVFLIESFSTVKEVGGMSGTAFNFEVILGTAAE